MFDRFGVDEYDEEGLTATINGLTSWGPTAAALRVRNNELFKTSYGLSKVIAGSQELAEAYRNAGVRFKTSPEDAAKLFEKNAENLDGILFNVDIPSVLDQLQSTRQFANFEAFIGKSIAEIYQEHSSPPSADENIQLKLWSHRNLLHYWLKSPHRERLLEIVQPNLLQVLAAEVDLEDSRFLLNNIH